jgi:small GTP-binding protein
MDATAEGTDVVYKLLLLGESNVGKTSIILRYIEDKFEESNISTCGIDLKCKYVSCDNKKIKLNIWDTAGQERFQGLAKNYLRGANGVIFVIDITKEKSFDDLKIILDNVKHDLSSEVQMIIVENKIDLEEDRSVSKEKLAQFAQDNNMEIFSASAKTGKGVENFFNVLIEKLFNNENIGKINNDEESEIDKEGKIKLDKHKVKSEKKKCLC